MFKVSIANKSGGEAVEIKAIAFPKICASLPTRINIDEYPHLHALELPDFDSSDDNGSCDSIDILIGADHYWDVVTGDVVRGENGPTAMSRKLGLLSPFTIRLKIVFQIMCLDRLGWDCELHGNLREQ